MPISAQAKVVLASGAGYRSLVDDLSDSYTKDTGNKVERIYGNMARVTAQARISGAVDMVLGDKDFLEKATLSAKTTQPVGTGKLVVAYPIGASYQNESDLLSKSITRIAIPDTQKAIYGKAAMQYLRGKGLYNKVESKLLIVGTVPQAASYVIAGEVDYALINLTHAQKISKSIGGYALIDQKDYSPIRIVIWQMNNAANEKECADFMAFLKSDKARKIIARHGM
ncbi:molybdate ABC transporter substrate-binding protein [Maridesulfovibrio frigidus]|uniref:molybdate ABC transporter substrate-binding protein n=1 Tax=Maridesulfovibrio frigidus TaxID=340956 RepID=UPI001F3B2FD7|nr:molybdate ABC transporter substrate-binding protein [Maridesulfovibrio frigidus]